MKNQLLILCTLVFSLNSIAQTTREEISKTIRDSKPNIEALVADFAKGMNQNKGKQVDETTQSLGATANKRAITVDYQLPNHELTVEQGEKLKKIMSAEVIKKGCAVPIMYVMVKEHEMSINYRYFDKKMKPITEFLLDKNSCS